MAKGGVEPPVLLSNIPIISTINASRQFYPCPGRISTLRLHQGAGTIVPTSLRPPKQYVTKSNRSSAGSRTPSYLRLQTMRLCPVRGKGCTAVHLPGCFPHGRNLPAALFVFLVPPVTLLQACKAITQVFEALATLQSPLHPCTEPLQRCKAFSHPCTKPLQLCKAFSHPCIMLLQPCKAFSH